MCYRLQYVAANGRKRGDPYSLRQTGVYHKHAGATNQSTWIILQPSKEMHRRVEEIFKNAQCSDILNKNPMLLHVVFLSSMASCWDEYVEGLRLELETFVCPPSSQLKTLLSTHRKRKLTSPELGEAANSLIQTSLLPFWIVKRCKCYSKEWCAYYLF